MTYYLLYDDTGARHWVGANISMAMMLLGAFARVLGRSTVLLRNDGCIIAKRNRWAQ